MSRTKGLISFSGNFEPRMAEPFDGRIRVETYSDLTKSATWINDDGNIYLYKEIIVSVYNDSNVENNGAYRLVDNNYTIADNWVKIGSVNHDDLTPESREMANQHPISAITGLQDELDSKLNKDFSILDESSSITKDEVVVIYDEVAEKYYKVAIKDLAPDLEDINVSSTQDLTNIETIEGATIAETNLAIDEVVGKLKNRDILLQHQIDGIIESSPVSFVKYFTDNNITVAGVSYKIMSESKGTSSAVSVSQSVTGTSIATANTIGVWVADNPADADFPVAQQVSMGQLQLKKSTGSGRVLNVFVEVYNMKSNGTKTLINRSNSIVVSGTSFSDYNFYIPIDAFTAEDGDRSRIEVKCFYSGSGVAFNAVLKIQEDYISKWSYSIPVSAISHSDTHITASSNHPDLNITVGENYDSILNKLVGVIVGNKDNTVITSTVIYNAPNNINYIVVGDTTTTINLPSTPTNFSDVKIVDSRGDASVNNITINGNGKNINDDTSVIIDTNFGYVNMRYIDNKWVIYNIG